mmetsp:Transcript_38101/g.100642  ORF Transcript_38101/g.100642 Transcript_38101/m.100642 type:complete len:252 (+) Transcript_38101:65-820(+)
MGNSACCNVESYQGSDDEDSEESYEDSEESYVRPTREILCYGDSNTAGFPQPKVPYGRTLEACLRAEGYPCNVTVVGNSGLTAKELLAKVNDPAIPDVTRTTHPGLGVLLKGKRWDLVIIMLGTNGLGSMQRVEDISSYIEGLHDVCHEHKVKTVALGAITISASIDEWALCRARSVLAEQLEGFEKADDSNLDEMCLSFADPKHLVPRKPEYWERDRLHWTAQGCAVFGSGVTPTVIKALDKLEKQERRH